VPSIEATKIKVNVRVCCKKEIKKFAGFVVGIKKESRALNEENKRLRTALRKIKTEKHCGKCSHRKCGYISICRCFFKLAKEALELVP